MQGDNGVVWYPSCLVERLAGNIVTTGEVMAVRDKHRSISGRDKKTGSTRKWRLSKIHPDVAGYAR